MVSIERRGLILRSWPVPVKTALYASKMIEPSLYEKLHWAALNFLSKVFAYGLVFVCFTFFLPVTANVAGKPTGAQFLPWLLVLVAPLLVAGALMIRAKPHYPEKYKEWYESRRSRRV